ncbi:hypothetical protein J2Y63_002459 [Shinella sp. BE166]
MTLDGLLDEWGKLEASIQRVLVSQPSTMTANSERMDEARLAFGKALRDYSRNPAGLSALSKEPGDG